MHGTSLVGNDVMSTLPPVRPAARRPPGASRPLLDHSDVDASRRGEVGGDARPPPAAAAADVVNAAAAVADATAAPTVVMDEA